MITLTETELDALTEAFNIVLGQAAASFSDLVHEPVSISVPSVEVIGATEMPGRVSAFYGPTGQSQLCGIHQSFHSSDDLLIDTMLVFTETGSLEIIRQMLGEKIPMARFNELEQDALAEIGNIIINSCMSSLADLFQISMIGTLPRLMFDDPLMLASENFGQDTVLLARISLSLTSKDANGLVLFFIDGGAIQNFVCRVERVFTLPS
jgi:chemotaxis protein CheC